MNLPLTLANLAGTVALLLWGVHMVQTGVQRAFGARLGQFLAKATKNRLAAFLAGMGVTAILQSSTATGLMVTGFAAQGLVDLVPSLAVMLGANVGSTLIVQVLSFNVSEIAPVLVLIGVLMFRRGTAGTHDLGRVFIGLGLILMALGQFLQLIEPYEDLPSLRMLLGAVASQPLLDVVLAAGLTWAAHSSVAVVILVMSFAAKGVVPPEAAFALVLGANLGTAINPVLEGAAGNDPAARRLPLGNLLNRCVGVALALLLLPTISRWMVRIEPDDARSVADFHTAFNVVLAVVFLPMLRPYARILRRWLPSRVDAADPAKPIYLDASARDVPFLALGAAAREALRLVDILETMLQGFRDAIDKPDRRQITEAKQVDDILDRLNSAIKRYLVSLDVEALGEEDLARLNQILVFSTNMEQAGDIVDRHLLGFASRKLERGLSSSRESREELLAIVDRLLSNLRAAATVFMTDDTRAARLLADEKRAFRQIEARATKAHFDQLKSGNDGNVEASTLHLDLMRDLKQVNAHLVASAAYPVLERHGDLLPSRLKKT
ncbi:phosphate:Na+ symporter [Faunimonas pinastri]|uniref:Phosphate:Na+ symporter n=1 Tax=Faunimonas pinastri TaxID=1855383 RepID=A0A1H9NJA1_9HYPH|nr:Na/Pi cotransporter family protein [Faunimonas pinastri]SER35971.1 phosphate:Na+ symporter [Faunimonas pinastri]